MKGTNQQNKPTTQELGREEARYHPQLTRFVHGVDQTSWLGKLLVLADITTSPRNAKSTCQRVSQGDLHQKERHHFLLAAWLAGKEELV